MSNAADMWMVGEPPEEERKEGARLLAWLSVQPRPFDPDRGMSARAEIIYWSAYASSWQTDNTESAGPWPGDILFWARIEPPE